MPASSRAGVDPPDFRGCSGELNRRPRAYHSGDSDEIDWILRRLQQATGGQRLHAAGISLGGNALLEWAGERAEAAAEVVTGVAGICAPLDLAACGHHLAHGFNRLYTLHFLDTLKVRSAARLQHFPGLFDETRMRRARNLWEFDDAVTRAGAWLCRSRRLLGRVQPAKPWLRSIAVPALVVNPKTIPSCQLPPCLALAKPAPASTSNNRPAAAMSASSADPSREIWTGCRKDSLHFFLYETP